MMTGHNHLAHFGAGEGGKDAQKSSLPGSVRTQQSDKLTLPNLKIQAAQNGFRTKRLYQTPDLNHAPPPTQGVLLRYALAPHDVPCRPFL